MCSLSETPFFSGQRWRIACTSKRRLDTVTLSAETTSGEEVFSFIAAAAGTGNDDHQHTEPVVSKKELEFLKRLSKNIDSSCVHCSNETLVRALRRKGAKPVILRLARDFVCPSCQEVRSQRPHPVARLEAIPSKWQNIQIDQAEWSHLTESLKNKFSVMNDEGCHVKVAKMLFTMKDTDLHRSLVWTELCDFYLEQWV